MEQATGRFVQYSEWSATLGRVAGKNSPAKVINSYLDALRIKVYDIERELIFRGETITYESFKNKWFGITEKRRMILELFEEHNIEVAQLIGKDYLLMTLKRYRTSLGHTRSFITWKYKAKDLDVKKLDYEFIKSYRNCQMFEP